MSRYLSFLKNAIAVFRPVCNVHLLNGMSERQSRREGGRGGEVSDDAFSRGNKNIFGHEVSQAVLVRPLKAG
jgi:hypothetical protein